MTLKKLRCLSSCFLAIFPFYLTGILNNQHSLNEYNNTTTQNNSLDLKTDFQIEYTNNLNENGTQNFKSNFLYYGDNYNEANKYIFDDAIKNINTNDYVNGINEIKNGLVLYSNNQYQLNVNSYNRIKKIRLPCGQKHSRFVPKCNLQHIHDRRCMKTEYYDCLPGCTFEYKNVVDNIFFKNNEFDDFFKSHFINSLNFDFSRILVFDENKSYKFFNKSLLYFDINYDYLFANILDSYNFYFSNIFYNKYKNEINDVLLNKICYLIYTNKITNFKEPIINNIGINITNIDKVHDYRYWIELSKYKKLDELLIMLDDLDFMKYKDYYEENYFVKSKDKYLWLNLNKIFFNENYSKNIFFKIDYSTWKSENNSIKISLYDLVKRQNNKIIYNFENNYESFDNQAIKINSIQLNSKDYNLRFGNKIGISIFNQLTNKYLKKDINKFDQNSWIVFNEKINYQKIFLINNISEEESKNFLLKNEMYNYPSMLNKNEFVKKITSIKSSIFFNLIDNNLIETDINIYDDFFKEFINDIEVYNFDSIGKSVIELKFNNSTKSYIEVNGLKKIKLDINYIQQNININSLSVSDISNIDKQFIIDNLIEFNDTNLNQKIFKINLSKQDFLINVLDEISFVFYNDYLVGKMKNKLNENEYEFYIYKSNKLNNSIVENDKNVESINSKNKNILFISVGLSATLMIIVIFLISYYAIKKKKK